MTLPNFYGLLAMNIATTAQIHTRELRIAAASVVQAIPNISVEFGKSVML